MLTHLSLFTGIGGADLAAEWAGFETVGQCEIDDYATRVLEKHWRDVPRWRDIRTLNKENFYARTGLRTVDVISGGFPCQPFSVAGKQKGKQDSRYLFPEMLRVIRELRPHCVIGENVHGILKIAAGDVVAGLEHLGYRTCVFQFEAAAVGAWHRRSRVFFVGYAEHDGFSSGTFPRSDSEAAERREEGAETPFEPAGAGGRPDDGVISDADREILQGQQLHAAPHAAESAGERPPCAAACELRQTACNALRGGWEGIQRREESHVLADGCQWTIEPDAGRVAYGIPKRVDRIRCLGNAIVPQQIYPIFRAIAEEIRRNKAWH